MKANRVDVVLFMGQSNMAGRGVADMAPRVQPGMGYEYRAITAPDRLVPLQEPFGKEENNPNGAPWSRPLSMPAQRVRGFLSSAFPVPKAARQLLNGSLALRIIKMPCSEQSSVGSI